jgi:hypothetical protein
MPIYVYETTDTSKPIRRFEVKQSMKDEPLRVDPKTGEAVRRVISGGYGVHVAGGSTGPSVGSLGLGTLEVIPSPVIAGRGTSQSYKRPHKKRIAKCAVHAFERAYHGLCDLGPSERSLGALRQPRDDTRFSAQ